MSLFFRTSRAIAVAAAALITLSAFSPEGRAEEELGPEEKTVAAWYGGDPLATDVATGPGTDGTNVAGWFPSQPMTFVGYGYDRAASASDEQTGFDRWSFSQPTP